MTRVFTIATLHGRNCLLPVCRGIADKGSIPKEKAWNQN